MRNEVHDSVILSIIENLPQVFKIAWEIRNLYLLLLVQLNVQLYDPYNEELYTLL